MEDVTLVKVVGEIRSASRAVLRALVFLSESSRVNIMTPSVSSCTRTFCLKFAISIFKLSTLLERLAIVSCEGRRDGFNNGLLVSRLSALI